MRIVFRRADFNNSRKWDEICKQVHMPTDVEKLCIECDQVSACRHTERSEDGQSKRRSD